jgi:hypothetical protein
MNEYISLIPSMKNLGKYYQPGLGYSPAAAGPVGGWDNTPGPGFFGKQPMESLIPAPVARFSFGKKGRHGRSWKKGKRQGRKFGYPLMNLPSSEINTTMFPIPPVGPGDTPGGLGGTILQGMPNHTSWWGFGSKSRKNRKYKKNRKSQKKRKSNRK